MSATISSSSAEGSTLHPARWQIGAVRHRCGNSCRGLGQRTAGKLNPPGRPLRSHSARPYPNPPNALTASHVVHKDVNRAKLGKHCRHRPVDLLALRDVRNDGGSAAEALGSNSVQHVLPPREQHDLGVVSKQGRACADPDPDISIVAYPGCRASCTAIASPSPALLPVITTTCSAIAEQGSEGGWMREGGITDRIARYDDPDPNLPRMFGLPGGVWRSRERVRNPLSERLQL
ncbi:hypothetical protein T492DRAFT_1125120 [Pavlovales sp. CCMP2436]|nr:hypothetical protein T492DRAFT_1125120 [Pavlovales sp. CCMP2436]